MINKYIPTQTSESKRYGHLIFYDITGSVSIEKFADSLHTYYFLNGSKESEGVADSVNFKIWTWTEWHANGKIKSLGKCSESCSEKTDNWKYWDSTGVLESEIIYNDTIYYSTFYTYHSNGNIKNIEKFKGPYRVTAKVIDYENNLGINEEVYIIGEFCKDYKNQPIKTWTTYNSKGAIVDELIYTQ